MEKSYFDLNNEKFETIDTNLPSADDKEFELDNIENTLRNINLSFLNDNNEFVENSNQEVITPVEAESQQLFDEPILDTKDQLEFEMPSLNNEENKNDAEFDFSPIINSMVNSNKELSINDIISTDNASSIDEAQEILNRFEKNKQLILAAKEKVDNKVFDPANKSRVTNSEHLREVASKAPQEINAATFEFENVINSFLFRENQKNAHYEAAEELNTFRI